MSETFHYRFSLRDKPRLAELAAESAEEDASPMVCELVRKNDDSWELGEMSLKVEPYVAVSGDEISEQPWCGKIRWIIESVGEFDSPDGSTFDDWYGMAMSICRRWGGALYSLHDGKSVIVDDGLRGAPLPSTRAQLADYVDRARLRANPSLPT